MCLGIPGEVAVIRHEGGVRMADVRFAGILREVCLECVPEAGVGDWVVVHVGFAISRVDREEAERAYRALDLMGHTKELTADGAPLPASPPVEPGEGGVGGGEEPGA